MWRCPSKTSGARRAAALGGSRARALRYVQVEEDSRHDEPSLGSSHSPPVGDWDRYEVLEYLGGGGMGRVFKAFDRRLGRHVAVKFIRGDDPELIRRFSQEARAQARVDHDRVCDQPVVFSDVLATLAGIFDLEQIAEGMAEDSVSFLPYLLDAGKTSTKRPPIIHDRYTIRDGDWKLILPRNKNKAKENPSGELYNLKEDLPEQHNLVTIKSDVAEELKTKLSSFFASIEE